MVVGWNSGLEMCRRSSLTVRLGGGVCTGTYCRRNLRLRRVNPDGTMYLHFVLIKLSDFNNNACLVPFGGMRTCLVLDTYMIADAQGWESLSVFHLPLSCFHVPLP